MSLLELAEAEAHKNGCRRLLRVKAEYGALAGIMPEALKFCFDCLVSSGPHEGAELSLSEVPVKLACPACGGLFDAKDTPFTLMACPECGAVTGLKVEEGRELVLLRIEAE